MGAGSGGERKQRVAEDSPLLSQLIEPVLDVAGKALNKHKALTCWASAAKLRSPSAVCCSWVNIVRRAALTSSAMRSSASLLRASSRSSRHCICCIRKAAGMAVLFSAWIGTPFSSHR
ncbi:hypothetical protein Y695_01162 [Hydrogenophaga sp. T4]|nr:hypothetical protein Y695_01162 [Hydrogenophaga sp. T4]